MISVNRPASAADHAQQDERNPPRHESSASSAELAYRLRLASNQETDNFGITVLNEEEAGRTTLHLAAAKGHLESVKAALQTGAKVNAADESGYTALHQAATEGYTDVVRLLLKNGAHVDAQDEMHGNTALHEAAWKGYSQTLEVLCKHKANVYIRNKGGFSSLHLACQNGHNQSCRVLLLAGCKPDIRNNYGDTPLHTAARYGHAGVLRILISAFCHVSEVNKNGDTALHIAAAMGRRKLTKILLESGCKQDIKNKQGETAKDIAARKGFTELLDILNNPPQRANHKLSKGSARLSSKKRDKDSGTSQGSRDNASRHKEKHKKSKHGHQVHFTDDYVKESFNGHLSPYGCHMFPNIASFPQPKLDSLPVDPLHKGEQYFIDLAGNIKKGPVGVGYACYCAPFFHHVEKKLEADKQDLMHHIDNAHEDLNNKIANLEKRTRNQLFNLNQNMKQKLAEEKEECQERQDRRARREKNDMEKRQQVHVENLKSEMKSWMHSVFGKTEPKRNGVLAVSTSSIHTNKSSSTLRKSKSHGEKINLMRSASIDSLSDSDVDSRENLSPVPRSRAPLCLKRLGSFLQSETSEGRPEMGYVNRLRTDFEKLGARPKHNSIQCHHRQSDPTALQRESKNGKSTSDLTTFLQMRRDSRSEGDLTTCHKYPGSRHPYVEPYPNYSQDSLSGSNCVQTSKSHQYHHHPSHDVSYQSSSHHPGPPVLEGSPGYSQAMHEDLSIGLPSVTKPDASKYIHIKASSQTNEPVLTTSPSHGCDSGIGIEPHLQQTSIDSSEEYSMQSSNHKTNGASLV